VRRTDRLRVRLAAPIKAYLRHAPTDRGRGFVTRHVLRPILPAVPTSFVLRRPGGSLVRLHYREALGLSAFVSGGFEDVECRILVSTIEPRSIAIDVGANVGIHAIPMAVACPSARVLAIEPAPNNAQRLRENVSANGIDNVEVIEAAVGHADAVTTLHLADDPAYGSTEALLEGHRETGQIAVEQRTLDGIWQGAERPRVSLAKIDVEGGELAVLVGARALLAAEHPVLLVEAHESELAGVQAELSRFGYRRRVVAGLQPWNHVFEARDARPTSVENTGSNGGSASSR